jgi:nitrous oxide reductase
VKKPSTPNPTSPVGEQPPRIARRGLLVGAGVAGAAAVAAGGLHRAMVAEVGAAAPAAAEGAGYRLTPHVLRYYETTKA